MSVHISTETLRDRRDLQEVSKVMKSKNPQLRLLYMARLSIKTEDEIKNSLDRKKLKKFIANKPLLKKC